MRVDTAANIITKALLELALVDSAPANVYTSTDAVVVQMRALLEGLGQDLVQEHSWSHLQKEHSFSTAPGTQDYALPPGFRSIIPQTQWNRSAQRTLAAAGPQAWQLLASSQALAGLDYYYRVRGNRLLLHPAPSTTETLAFEYSSALWVVPAGEAQPTADVPTANDDALWFDRRLLVAGLKLRWLEAKGFDTTAAQRAYESALSASMDADGAPQVLSLSPREVPQGPCLPDTGLGA